MELSWSGLRERFPGGFRVFGARLHGDRNDCLQRDGLGNERRGMHEGLKSLGK